MQSSKNHSLVTASANLSPHSKLVALLSPHQPVRSSRTGSSTLISMVETGEERIYLLFSFSLSHTIVIPPPVFRVPWHSSSLYAWSWWCLRTPHLINNNPYWPSPQYSILSYNVLSWSQKLLDFSPFAFDLRNTPTSLYLPAGNDYYCSRPTRYPSLIFLL